MSEPSATQKREIATMLGYVAGLHTEAKALEAEGIVEMDMVCCALEDLFGTLEPLLSSTMSQAEGLARSS